LLKREKLDPSHHVHGTVWLFLAQAHHGLGEAVEARRWLDKAVAWFAQEVTVPGGYQLRTADRGYFEQLRLETEALLAGRPVK
jgi:hypothetical protein